MKRSLFSAPDSFANSPLLALLPVRGDVTRLPALSSSLYARYEKVSTLLKVSEENKVQGTSRLRSEEGMLRTVLDWLATHTEGINQE